MSLFHDFQGMEKKIRDQVGVQDFVLLEDYTNEDAFLANLRKRAEADTIYVSGYSLWRMWTGIKNSLFLLQTYIGQVLIAVNPYKELPIYTEDVILGYRKKYFFQAPPHMYVICFFYPFVLSPPI